MLQEKYYINRKIVKAAIEDARDDKQSRFPSVKKNIYI